MKSLKLRLGSLLLLSMILWYIGTGQSACIQFSNVQDAPYNGVTVFDKTFIAAGAAASVPGGKQNQVRCRLKDCEDKDTPSGKFRRNIQRDDKTWEGWTEVRFDFNSSYVTVEWNDSTKSKGHRVQYVYPNPPYSAQQPCADHPVDYTATFSTEGFFTGYTRVGGELTQEGAHTEKAQVQVWPLLDIPPSNPQIGQRYASKLGDDSGVVNAFQSKQFTTDKVSYYSNVWVACGTIPSADTKY